MTSSSEEIINQIIKKREEAEKKGTATKVTTLDPQIKAIEERVNEIPEGFVAYSTIFGKSHSGFEHPVKQFKDEDWPEELRMHIPDAKKFDGYIFPKREGELLVVALMQGDKTFMHGPKGSGKSSITEYVCSKLRIPFIRVNCREDMESSAIFGSVNVKEGNLEWEGGPAEELGRAGGILQLDELSATPAGINMAMQWMLEEDGRIYLADKPAKSDEKLVVPHEWFRVVATDNTQLQGDDSGIYGGTQVQNSAMLDRFQTTIEIGYLSKSHETKILNAKVPDLPKEWIQDMLKFTALVRTAFQENKTQFTMSPRTLINWGRKSVYWKDPVLALRIAFLDKLIEDDKKLINDFCIKVFGRGV